MTGKELVQKLRESGTGKPKLDVMRAVLKKKPTASAAALIKALKKSHDSEAGIVPPLTISKAEQILRDGEYHPPTRETMPNIEDLPGDATLPDDDDDDDEDLNDEPEAPPKGEVWTAKDVPPAGGKPANWVETPAASEGVPAPNPKGKK